MVRRNLEVAYPWYKSFLRCVTSKNGICALYPCKTVVAAEASNRWTVQFDMDGKVKSCHSNGFKVLSGTPGTGIPLDEATSMMEEDLIAGGGG
eukprot:scaffold58962_cov36-Attheya_sp.AAC.1